MGWCVYGMADVIPTDCDVLIQTEKGIRPLQMGEWAALKEVPMRWELSKSEWEGVIWCPGVHFWSALGLVLTPLFTNGERLPCVSAEVLQPGTVFPEPTGMPKTQRSAPAVESDDLWDWEVPNLQEGGDWHCARLKPLQQAISGLTNEVQLWEEGQALLPNHRLNYGATGPTALTVL